MPQEVNALDSIDIEIKQLSLFYEDLMILNKHTLNKYDHDFKELRDKTNQLRSEYATLYAKILTENPKLKVYVGGI